MLTHMCSLILHMPKPKRVVLQKSIATMRNLSLLRLLRVALLEADAMFVCSPVPLFFHLFDGAPLPPPLIHRPNMVLLLHNADPIVQEHAAGTLLNLAMKPAPAMHSCRQPASCPLSWLCSIAPTSPEWSTPERLSATCPRCLPTARAWQGRWGLCATCCAAPWLKSRSTHLAYFATLSTIAMVRVARSMRCRGF